MNLLLDTISGEAPPGEIIKGATQALSSIVERDMQLIFVGDEKINRKHFRDLNSGSSQVSYIDAPEHIGMEDPPVQAVRRNPRSSLVQGCRFLKDNPGVFISPGNTGAVVAASLLELGRISGVARPGLAIILPSLSDRSPLLIDVGATTDATPLNMAQFAVMGRIYASEVLSTDSPRIGLLNIGEEDRKGNQLTKESSTLLKKLKINYVGNVEPHYILTKPPADVIVCEGFTGNVLLKSFEGGSSGALEFFKRAVSRSLRAKLGGWLLAPEVNRLREQLSFSQFGAAPLLGVKGTIFVGHGRSGAPAIKSAILNSLDAGEWDLPGKISKAMESMEITEKDIESSS